MERSPQRRQRNRGDLVSLTANAENRRLERKLPRALPPVGGQEDLPPDRAHAAAPGTRRKILARRRPPEPADRGRQPAGPRFPEAALRRPGGRDLYRPALQPRQG